MNLHDEWELCFSCRCWRQVCANLLIFKDFSVSGFTVEIDKNHIQQVALTYKIFLELFNIWIFSWEIDKTNLQLAGWFRIWGRKVQAQWTFHTQFTACARGHCPFVTTEEIRWAAEVALQETAHALMPCSQNLTQNLLIEVGVGNYTM